MAYLLKDVMKQGIVCIIVHDGKGTNVGGRMGRGVHFRTSAVRAESGGQANCSLLIWTL